MNTEYQKPNKSIPESYSGAAVQNNNGKGSPLKNAPPKGVSDDDHAQSQRKIRKTKGCAHCNGSKHLTNWCPYLKVEARYTEWKPNGFDWVYKKGQQSGKTLETMKKETEARKKAKKEENGSKPQTTPSPKAASASASAMAFEMDANYQSWAGRAILDEDFPNLFESQLTEEWKNNADLLMIEGNPEQVYHQNSERKGRRV